jgi:transposase
MPYRIAGIDVHKAMSAVVVADVEGEGDWQFERRRFGATPSHLYLLTEWLVEREVEEVGDGVDCAVLAPRCGTRWNATGSRRGARGWTQGLRPARCISRKRSQNGGPHGRKRDFPDAERLVKRLVAHELTLSFVPEATQRLWRTVTRRKYQLTRNRVQLQNRLESLLEEEHLKLSTLVSRSARGKCAAHAPRGCQRRDRSRHGRRTKQSPACTPRRNSCAMRSGPRRICIPSTAGCPR